MEDLNWRVNIRIYKWQRGIEVVRDQDPKKLIWIIWSLEIAKNMMLNNIHVKWVQIKKEKPQKTMINKNDAMKVYLELGTKIKDRLLAIQRSHDSSQFDINPDLLDLV